MVVGVGEISQRSAIRDEHSAVSSRHSAIEIQFSLKGSYFFLRVLFWLNNNQDNDRIVTGTATIPANATALSPSVSNESKGKLSPTYTANPNNARPTTAQTQNCTGGIALHPFVEASNRYSLVTLKISLGIKK